MTQKTERLEIKLGRKYPVLLTVFIKSDIDDSVDGSVTFRPDYYSKSRVEKLLGTAVSRFDGEINDSYGDHGKHTIDFSLYEGIDGFRAKYGVEKSTNGGGQEGERR
jgi:hypothetical protein